MRSGGSRSCFGVRSGSVCEGRLEPANTRQPTTDPLHSSILVTLLLSESGDRCSSQEVGMTWLGILRRRTSLGSLSDVRNVVVRRPAGRLLQLVIAQRSEVRLGECVAPRVGRSCPAASRAWTWRNCAAVRAVRHLDRETRRAVARHERPRSRSRRCRHPLNQAREFAGLAPIRSSSSQCGMWDRDRVLGVRARAPFAVHTPRAWCRSAGRSDNDRACEVASPSESRVGKRISPSPYNEDR